MKKTVITLFLLVLWMLSYEQVVNINPDSQGDPWWSGCVLKTDSFPDADSVQILDRSSFTDSIECPVAVHNQHLMYFPPIINQGYTGACEQVAEMCYVFTYERNRMYNVSAGDWEDNVENIYHFRFTYNFLNEGNGLKGTSARSGFRIAQKLGVPQYHIYKDELDTISNKSIYWMSGYEKYLSGMKDRVGSHFYIHFDPFNSGLYALKRWLYDRGSKDTTRGGGLAVINVYSVGMIKDSLDIFEYDTAREVIIQWGDSSFNSHALTIVGYNDTIGYDVNKDGYCTDTIDINNDSIINYLDKELGCFEVANSFGRYYGNDGFIWVPYRLLFDDEGMSMNQHAITCIADTVPRNELITKKIELECNYRDSIEILTGYGSNASVIKPPDNNIKIVSAFWKRGGDFPMQGINDRPIEIGLDYSYYFGKKDFGRVFLMVKEHDLGDTISGRINKWSLIDYDSVPLSV